MPAVRSVVVAAIRYIYSKLCKNAIKDACVPGRAVRAFSGWARRILAERGRELGPAGAKMQRVCAAPGPQPAAGAVGASKKEGRLGRGRVLR